MFNVLLHVLLGLLTLLLPAMALGQASQKAHETAAALQPGVNFGNVFDAPREGDWGLRLQDDFFALVGEGTPIRSVRLPVRWSNHASPDAEARIDPAFLARVTLAVDRLLARDVTVILNQHHYRQLDGDALDPGERAVDATVVEARFLAIWGQLSQHFAGHSPRLLFEIYNEPHGRLNARWNALLAQAHAVIRKHNPDRLLVIGPTHWNAAHALPALRLPADSQLILTVHHYEPFAFTHQGATWVQPTLPTRVGCCSAAQLQAMREPLDQAQAEAKRLGFPVFVGEWGSYSAAPLPARLAHARAMRTLMAERKLPNVWWELASGFGFYDPITRTLRPELHAALFDFPLTPSPTATPPTARPHPNQETP